MSSDWKNWEFAGALPKIPQNEGKFGNFIQ